MSDELKALVDDSREAIDAGIMAKELAAERLRRRNQGLVIALAVALLAAVTAGIFFFRAQTEADNARAAEATAQQAARRARANELAAYTQNAMTEHPNDPSLALLLAINSAEATRSTDNYIARNADRALREAVAFAPPYRMTLPRHRHASAYSAAYSPDGKSIVTASADQTGRIWDAATGQELLQLTGHSGPVLSAAYSPDGKTIVTASWDQTARIWDAANGQELLQLTGHSGSVLSAAYSPDGKTIVTASDDKTARIWDAATGEQWRELTGHTGYVSSAAYSPDGKTIVTASDDQTARIWDASTGKELRQLTGHSGSVTSAAYSPDGKTIVTASGDQTARIWDAATGEELRELTGHGGPVSSAAYSPDGKTIVTASWRPDCPHLGCSHRRGAKGAHRP